MERVRRDWCLEAIAFLRAGLDLGPNHDMRATRVYAALDYLETQLGSIWSIVKFRRMMEIRDPAARWHFATAALADMTGSVATRRRKQVLQNTLDLSQVIQSTHCAKPQRQSKGRA